jgi:hypothetical protein
MGLSQLISVRICRALARGGDGTGAEGEKDATFLEKLSFQIIKNIQIRIGSVHIRYEDKVSNPFRAFCLGVTLNELSLESTDNSFKSGSKPKEDSQLIHKVGRGRVPEGFSTEILLSTLCLIFAIRLFFSSFKYCV